MNKSFPETSKVIKAAVLKKYPRAKPNEYRAEWRDKFEEFRQDQEKVASRILWMLDWMITDDFFHNGIRPNHWIRYICGQMEGLCWIQPGIFIGALHTDHSMGNDEYGEIK